MINVVFFWAAVVVVVSVFDVHVRVESSTAINFQREKMTEKYE